MLQSGHGRRDRRTDGRTDGRTDRRTDRRTEWNQYTPQQQLRCSGGIINSLVPGRFEWNFRCTIFKLILLTDGWGISCEIAVRWMSLDLTGGTSTLAQVMAEPGPYLSQCWPRPMSPYGVTRPKWVYESSVIQILQTRCRSNTSEYYPLGLFCIQSSATITRATIMRMPV